MDEAEDSNEQMEENEDGEKHSLPPLVDQPNVNFLAQFPRACGIVADLALRGSGGLEALQAKSLCFIALVVDSA